MRVQDTQQMLKLSKEPGRAELSAQKRRVKVEPLGSESSETLTEPKLAQSAVTYDLFAWATKNNRKGPVPHRRIKVPNSAVGGTQLTAREQARSQERLQNYFEFGAGRSMKTRSGSFELNVHRNRIVFVLFLCALTLYSLSWLAE